ncbi:hypothetical protein PIB30_037196, partial [Stylosanthes scabra]|nr:hypothetical protein [Stylosanthes scabra]
STIPEGKDEEELVLLDPEEANEIVPLFFPNIRTENLSPSLGLLIEDADVVFAVSCGSGGSGGGGDGNELQTIITCKICGLVAGTLARGPPAATVSRDVNLCPTWKQRPHRHLLLPMVRCCRKPSSSPLDPS